jgi:multiple sugar transport system substrate-binding protein
MLFAGCPKPAAPPSAAELPFTGVETTVVLVDAPAVAAALAPLKSQWKAATGGELEVREISAEQFLSARSSGDLNADAVVYPPRLLGHLAEREWLMPLSKKWLADEQLAWSSIFELLQVRSSTWGSQVVAVPLGSPVFTLMYRADIFEQMGKTPPNTWNEYAKLAKEVATAEPIGPQWAGKLLLARAAAYGRHRDNYSTLFRMDTMEPLIAGEPFVRALTELVADTKSGKFVATAKTPREVEQAILTDSVAMGLTWTTAAKPVAIASQDGISAYVTAVKLPEGAKIRFAELPGAPQAYNVGTNKWEDRTTDQSPRVTLLDAEGLVGSVVHTTENPEAAFRLLAWLSGPEWSARVLPVSPRTTLFRSSHLSNAKDWVNAALDPTAATNYGEVVQASLSRETYLFVPRIPGAEEYLAALDTAVQQALSEEKTPQAALAEAAAAWVQITQRLGLQSQRRAYQRELGLDP